MSWKLPSTCHLPSGRAVRLSDPRARAAAAALREGAPREGAPSGASEGPFAEALAILTAEGVVLAEDGAAVDVYTWSVRDVHALRVMLTRAGLVAEEPVPLTCENCGEPFEVAPTALFEAGPFVDGELSDPELDAPFPFGEPLAIPRLALPQPRPRDPRGTFSRLRRGPRAASAPRASAETVTFADRTAGEARALFRVADALITGRVRALRVTPAIVLGMGVVALGGERRTPVLADALASASNAAWAAVVAHWHDAAYPLRLFGLHRCAKCGARNDIDVPAARELLREPPPREGGPRGAPASRPPFPDLDAFEAAVRASADRVYTSRGVRNIDLVVDDGVAACDDGGEPLLGSYLPGGHDEDTGIARPPEVRLYYRTFRSEYAADPTFDVDAEILETIDHEIEHHLHHLSGHDPMDAEERAVIEDEEARRVGKRETVRRTRRAFASDLAGFLRTTWPLWVAVVIAGLITWWSSR